jgi:hypothetical protein
MSGMTVRRELAPLDDVTKGRRTQHDDEPANTDRLCLPSHDLQPCLRHQTRTRPRISHCSPGSSSCTRAPCSGTRRRPRTPTRRRRRSARKAAFSSQRRRRRASSRAGRRFVTSDASWATVCVKVRVCSGVVHLAALADQLASPLWSGRSGPSPAARALFPPVDPCRLAAAHALPTVAVDLARVIRLWSGLARCDSARGPHGRGGGRDPAGGRKQLVRLRSVPVVETSAGTVRADRASA